MRKHRNQLQKQNLQPLQDKIYNLQQKTKFTTRCKDKTNNQMQRQNLQ